MSDKHTPEMYVNHRRRMREAALRRGAGGLTDCKLLEIFLFEPLPRIDTYPAAHYLLERFGSLDKVFTASREELLSVHGIGPKTADHIMTTGRLITEAVLEKFTASPLDSEYRTAPVLLWLMRDAKTDGMLILTTDGEGGLICYSPFPPGTGTDEIAEYLSRAKELGAKRCVLAHRHTEGMTAATADDVKVTDVVSDLCSGLGVDLAGHYVVTDSEVVGVIRKEGKTR